MAQHWAKAPIERNQIVLFSPTLEDAVSQDHPVRLLDEILRGLEWSDWVTPCTDHRGRPPIHPRILAAILLYGLMRRIRSSRMLEYMCGHNVDFIWLTEGHRPDHTTLSGFRKESSKALKGLFRQVGRMAMAMGLVRLVEVAFDGTRVKANASRYHTWTAAKAEAALKELDLLFDRMTTEADQADAAVQEGLFAGESANHLPAELATVEERRQKLQEILQTLRLQDESRRKAGMEQRKVTFFTPMESSQPQEGNPARRADPSEPVAEADWSRLPRNAQKRLDKSCFSYDSKSDCYRCPQGRSLPFAGIQPEVRNGQRIEIRVYRCESCKGCPLSSACRSPQAKRGRMIYRDAYEPLREETAARMQTPEGRTTYRHRMHGAETPFAHIKQVMGVRQFLLRDLENVRTEWRWVCTAFNLQKLLRHLAALRAELSRVTAEVAVG